MSLKINIINCPSCGAAIPIEPGKTQLCCSYCGSKLTVTNENEHIVRHVDEAQMKKAETERMKWLYEVEKETRKREAEQKKIEDAQKRRKIVIWGCVLLFFAAMIKGNSTIVGLLLFAGAAYLISRVAAWIKGDSHKSVNIDANHYSRSFLPPIPGNARPAGRFCAHCGAKIPDGAQFCHKCGKSIKENNSKIEESISFLQEVKNDPTSLLKKDGPMTSKRKTILIMSVFFVLMLIILPSERTNSHSYSSSSSSSTVTNYRVEEGAEYAYVYDSYSVYIATAVSDEWINIERWEYVNGVIKRDGVVGAFKINDPEYEFSWLDDQQTAFQMKFTDEDNYHMRNKKKVVFTMDINDEAELKPTNFNSNIAIYLYQNDESHAYLAIPLTEDLIKIECWKITKKDSDTEVMYDGDRWLLRTDGSDEDFEWTNSEHTAFTAGLKDDLNYSWDKEKLVLFEVHNPDAAYKTCLEYRKAKNGNTDANNAE